MSMDINFVKAKEWEGGGRVEVGKGEEKGDSCNHVNIKKCLK